MSDNNIQWETRAILPTGDGKMVEQRTGYDKFTNQDVSESHEVAWDGPPLMHVGRGAGDSERWEHIKAVKREQFENETPEPLPNITKELHDYAERVIHENTGRRTFGGLGGILTKKKESHG